MTIVLLQRALIEVCDIADVIGGRTLAVDRTFPCNFSLLFQ